jgi:hypothetical protein
MGWPLAETLKPLNDPFSDDGVNMFVSNEDQKGIFIYIVQAMKYVDPQ